MVAQWSRAPETADWSRGCWMSIWCKTIANSFVWVLTVWTLGEETQTTTTSCRVDSWSFNLQLYHLYTFNSWSLAQMQHDNVWKHSGNFTTDWLKALLKYCGMAYWKLWTKVWKPETEALLEKKVDWTSSSVMWETQKSKHKSHDAIASKIGSKRCWIIKWI